MCVCEDKGVGNECKVKGRAGITIQTCVFEVCESAGMHENPCVDVCARCRAAHAIGRQKLIIHFKGKFVDINSVLVAH